MCCAQPVFCDIIKNGMKQYSHYKDYSYQNDFSVETAITLDEVQKVSQFFMARGNLLNSISIYLADNPNQVVHITV